MHAVRFHEPGGPERLRYEEAPTPSITADEVLVRVAACGVNHIDIWVRTGTYPTALPHILGTDVAGVVEQVGAAVEAIKVGDHVVLYPVLACNACEYCLAGWPNRCDFVKLLGAQVDGGYAEYVKVPAHNALVLPQNVSLDTAAGLPVNFGTVWNALVTKAGIQPSDTVLVLAAGSGVGQAAFQLAKLVGAKVIATAGSEGKLSRARQLGADAVINHYEQDVAQEARRLTRGHGVDIVVDHVGSATWEKSLRSLARGGRVVSIGVTTGSEGKFDIRQIYRNELTIYGVYAYTKADLHAVLNLAAAGKIKPVIDRVLPLQEAIQAHRILEGREHFGKILLKP